MKYQRDVKLFNRDYRIELRFIYGLIEFYHIFEIVDRRFRCVGFINRNIKIDRFSTIRCDKPSLFYVYI